MLGIVWDVNKLIEMVRYAYVDEIQHLRGQLLDAEHRYEYLNNTLHAHYGIIRGPEATPEVTAGATAPLRVHNWKSQRAILEKKFRPPELADRERQWKAAAATAAQELEGEKDAGEEREAV